MRTNMKENWSDRVFEIATAPYTVLVGCSAIHTNGRKIVLYEEVAIKDGKLLNSDDPATHKVIALKATTSGNKLSIEAVDLVSNEPIIINI